MAFAAQLISRRKSGRTAADDGDLLAGVFGRFEFVAFTQGGVADVLLDGVDADVVLDLLRLQPSSQGAGQTRPMIEGKGLASV